MKYQTVVPGRFLARPNRFIARVETETGVETVHVKNTGRCRGCLLLPAADAAQKGCQYDQADQSEKHRSHSHQADKDDGIVHSSLL